MSVYAVNKICRDALHDPAFREAVKRDPAAAIASRDVSGDERQALLAGDVAWLYDQGCHPFLMSYLTRWESVRAQARRLHRAHPHRARYARLIPATAPDAEIRAGHRAARFSTACRL